MKTKLYKYLEGDEIKTFDDIKNDFAESEGADLPISDDEMELIIMLRLVQNGGDIVLLEDEILDWCNKYAEYNEADRYLSKTERDESVKIIYENIVANGEFAKELAEDLLKNGDVELYERLQELLKGKE